MFSLQRSDIFVAKYHILKNLNSVGAQYKMVIDIFNFMIINKPLV